MSKPDTENTFHYHTAQRALADMKAAIYGILGEAGKEGLRNVHIGRQLGLYSGHGSEGRHEGHITRTLLSMMESEGVVEQLEDKAWRLSTGTHE